MHIFSVVVFVKIVLRIVDTIWCHKNVIFWTTTAPTKMIRKLFSHYFCSFQSDTSKQLEFVHFPIVSDFTRASISSCVIQFLARSFFFGSQWQHNKCNAKTIFPTHQTNIPLCSVINALAFLFKTERYECVLCIRVCMPCMYRINPLNCRKSDIMYAYQSSLTTTIQATTAPYEYVYFQYSWHSLEFMVLGFSFFLFSIGAHFSSKCFSACDFVSFFCFCSFEHWIHNTIFKSSTVIISTKCMFSIGNLTEEKYVAETSINVMHGYGRFGCFHRLSIPKSRH